MWTCIGILQSFTCLWLVGLVGYGIYAWISGSDLESGDYIWAVLLTLIWLETIPMTQHESSADDDDEDLGSYATVMMLFLSASSWNDVLQPEGGTAGDPGVRMLVVDGSTTRLLAVALILIFWLCVYTALFYYDARWLDAQLRLLASKEIPGEIDQATFAEQRDNLQRLAEVLYGEDHATTVVVEAMTGAQNARRESARLLLGQPRIGFGTYGTATDATAEESV